MKAGISEWYDQETVLVRQSKVYGDVQKFVLESLLVQLLYTSHYPVLFCHSVGIRLYDTLRREFHSPHINNDAYTRTAYFLSCTVQGTRSHHQKKLYLFPAAGPLKLVEMEILGPLAMTKSSNQHVII